MFIFLFIYCQIAPARAYDFWWQPCDLFVSLQSFGVIALLAVTQPD
jgi:hypothetical protein